MQIIRIIIVRGYCFWRKASIVSLKADGIRKSRTRIGDSAELHLNKVISTLYYMQIIIIIIVREYYFWRKASIINFKADGICKGRCRISDSAELGKKM